MTTQAQVVDIDVCSLQYGEYCAGMQKKKGVFFARIFDIWMNEWEDFIESTKGRYG